MLRTSEFGLTAIKCLSLIVVFRALADMLGPHRKLKTVSRQPRASLDTSSSKTDDQDTDGQSDSAVLPSSTELFYFYGQSLEQCAKLSAGRPLFDLSNVHKKWLKIYAGMYNAALDDLILLE